MDSNFLAMLSKAVSRGCISEEQARDCAECFEKETPEDPDLTLETLLLEKGYLTLVQLNALLDEEERIEPAKAVHLSREGSFQDELYLRNLKPGYMVGTSRIIKFLGAGGMGTVYLAEQQYIKRRVAIKFITGNDAAQYRRRFSREVQITAHLDHPNIVKTYSAEMGSEVPYLVMEYIQGISLEKYMKSFPLTLVQKLQIVHTLALALDYAHRKGVVHRDIKPSNIMVQSDGTLKIMDFGLAKSSRLFDKSLTKTGDVIGTLRYMSPEQAQGERDIDCRSDIYALGAILYEMASGKRIFDEKSGLNLLKFIVRESPRFPRDIDPSLPRAVEAIILKSLEKDREKRYPTAQKMAEEIEHYLNDAPGRAIYGFDLKKALRRASMHKAFFFYSGLLLAFCVLGWNYFKFFEKRMDPPFSSREEVPSLVRAWEEMEIVSREVKERPSLAGYARCIELLEKLGQFQAGVEKCEEAMRWANGNRLPALEIEKKQALFSLQVEDYRAALRLYQRLYQSHEHPLFAVKAAEALFGLRRYVQAMELLSRLEPSKMDALLAQEYHFFYGASLLRIFLGKISRAEYLKDVREKSFQHDESLGQAIRYLDKAVEESASSKDQFHMKACVYRGYAHVCRGDLQKGEKILDRCSFSDVFFEEAKGILYYAQGDYARSVDSFTRCIQIEPWESSYYHFRAQAHLQSDAFVFRTVLLDCLKAIDLFPYDHSPIATINEAMLKRVLYEEWYFSIFLILSCRSESKENISPNLWAQECEELTGLYLKQYQYEQHQSKGSVSTQELEFVLDAMLKSEQEAPFNIAQNIFGNSWHQPEAWLVLEQSKTKAKNPGSLKKWEKIRTILEDKKALSQKKQLRCLLARYFVGRDSSVREEFTSSHPETLIEFMYDPCENVQLRYWASMMLKAMKSPETYAMLEKEAKSQDPSVKALALSALSEKEKDLHVASPLFSEIQRLPDDILAILFHHLAGKIPLDIVSKYLDHPNEKVRLTAARACRFLSGESSPSETMWKSCTSADEEVRTYAHFWLWAPHYVVLPLESSKGKERERLLDAFGNDPSHKVRLSAIACMSRMVAHESGQSGWVPPESVVPALKKMLTTEKNSVIRIWILSTLLDFKEFQTVTDHVLDPREGYCNRTLVFFEVLLKIFLNRSKVEAAELGFRFFAKVIKQNPVHEPDPRFAAIFISLSGQLGRENIRLHPVLLDRYLIQPIKEGLHSPHRQVRIGASRAFLFIEDMAEKTIACLQERFEIEKDDDVKRAILASLTYQKLLNAEKSGRREESLVEEVDESFRKAVAYGHYRFLEKHLYQGWNEPLDGISSDWQLDQKYFSYLKGLLDSQCLRVWNQSKPHHHDETVSRFFKGMKQGSKRASCPHVFQFALENEQSASKQEIGPEVSRRIAVIDSFLGCLQKLQVATSLAPSHGRYFFEMSFLLEYLGELERAYESLEKAISLEPSSTLYKTSRARLCFKLGRMEEANESIDEVLKKKFFSGFIFKLKGEICMEMGNGEEALDFFKRWHALERDNANPLLFQANLLLSQGKIGESGLILRRVHRSFLEQEKQEMGLDESPHIWMDFYQIGARESIGNYHFAMARFHLKQGDIEEASRYLEKGRVSFLYGGTNFPISPWSRKNLGRYPEFDSIKKQACFQKLPFSIRGLLSLENGR